MGLLVLALVGLAVGIALGLPGRYEQTPDDLDRLMEQGGGTRRRREKRTISPLAWVQRKLSKGATTGARRRGFNLQAPGDPGAEPPRTATPGDLPRSTVRFSRGPVESAEEGEGEARRPRTREQLREGRFKLRHPEEGGSD